MLRYPIERSGTTCRAGLILVGSQKLSNVMKWLSPASQDATLAKLSLVTPVDPTLRLIAFVTFKSFVGHHQLKRFHCCLPQPLIQNAQIFFHGRKMIRHQLRLAMI